MRSALIYAMRGVLALIISLAVLSACAIAIFPDVFGL